jgi:hypothetical protein
MLLYEQNGFETLKRFFGPLQDHSRTREAPFPCSPTSGKSLIYA